MNLICAECAYRRLSKIGDIIEKSRLNEANRIKATVGNSRKSYICFDCGHKLSIGTACAAVHAEGEDIRNFVIPTDEQQKHYTEDWGNYGGRHDQA